MSSYDLRQFAAGLGRSAALCGLAACSLAPAGGASAQTASGPLRVHPTNPRYFADAQGRAVYLTGSHTWANLQDQWTSDYAPFNFDAYLDMLQANGHNFIRLWRIELPEARYHEEDAMEHTSPHPWSRGSSGPVTEVEPKFNLKKFDDAHFARLRDRCIKSGQRGMYVGVMLFEGHGLSNTIDGWFSHPFNIANNTNGVNGDPDGDGRGEETHTLGTHEVLGYQEAYVRKVIDTVNDLDNVIFEISNESHPGSVAWQNHFIDFVKAYEATLPKQHLVWFSTTFPNGNDNAELWASNADVISPGTAAANGAYRDNPPANDGSKIIIVDTDHLWGCGGSGEWVWKSFTCGLHPIYMDGYLANSPTCVPDLDIRKQMGFARQYALRMNLANALPSAALANTGWCLADAGDAYVVFAPNGGTVTLNLTGAPGTFDVEWFRPDTGQTITAGTVAGGAPRNFSPPFAGSVVLFVQNDQPGGIAGDVNNDGLVNVSDLLMVIGAWGPCAGCAADINDDGMVNVSDLLMVIGNWSP